LRSFWISGQGGDFHPEVQRGLGNGLSEPACPKDEDFLIFEMGLRQSHEKTKYSANYG